MSHDSWIHAANGVLTTVCAAAILAALRGLKTLLLARMEVMMRDFASEQVGALKEDVEKLHKTVNDHVEEDRSSFGDLRRFFGRMELRMDVMEGRK